MAFLIDSSIFIAFERRGDTPDALIAGFGDETVALASITASELLHGVHRAESAVRRGRRETFVETILQDLLVIPFTLEIARVHSRLWVDLQLRGEIIRAHDLIIAATALAHDLTLITGDRRHFGKIDHLSLEVW